MTIGIVTISFNQAPFLAEAIKSVVVSSRHRLEYVVVDPGSTDGSREIIERHRHVFAELVLEPDSGPADGLNKGFARLRDAEICGYLNADDRFSPGALDYVCDFFKQNQSVDILFGSIQLIDKAGKRMLRGRRVQRVTPERFIAGVCPIWQQATFFRRSAFEKASGFNINNRISWDAEVAIDMLLAGARAGYVDRALGDFRLYGESISGSRDYQAKASREHDRVVRKLYARGYKPTPPVISKILRTFDKISPVRHLSNVLVGLQD